MFESTADKVLRVLIANEDKPTVGEKFSAVKATVATNPRATKLIPSLPS